jgi:hypothetical protein
MAANTKSKFRPEGMQRQIAPADRNTVRSAAIQGFTRIELLV